MHRHRHTHRHTHSVFPLTLLDRVAMTTGITFPLIGGVALCIVVLRCVALCIVVQCCVVLFSVVCCCVLLCIIVYCCVAAAAIAIRLKPCPLTFRVREQ